MKKLNFGKFIQLMLYLILAVGFGAALFLSPTLLPAVRSDFSVGLLFWAFWLLLILGLVFLFLDFRLMTALKKEYYRLEQLVYGDPVAGGIANRYSCDTLLEKYEHCSAPLDIGCIMIDLTNLMEINKSYDRQMGNQLLKDFSTILESAAVSLCFVGRNSGNKFLAVFEDCTQEKMDTFLQRIAEKVTLYNQDHSPLQIAYAVGSAINTQEKLDVLTELVALANNRIPVQ